MKIAMILFMLSPLMFAQQVQLDLQVYIGSYSAQEAGSVIISLPEGKLTPTNGPSVAEEIMDTFHLKTLKLAKPLRIVISAGETGKLHAKLPEGSPVETVQLKFRAISVNRETANVSLQFSTNDKDFSGAEMMVKMGQPFTLSSRLDGHLAFLICTLNPVTQIGDTLPIVVNKEAPAYPEDLRKAKVQGVAVLKLRIDEKGRVVNCEKAKADDDRFVAPACEAAMKWEFEPARKDGKPIAYDYFVTMSFKLD